MRLAVVVVVDFVPGFDFVSDAASAKEYVFLFAAGFGISKVVEDSIAWVVTLRRSAIAFAGSQLGSGLESGTEQAAIALLAVVETASGEVA